MEKIGCGFRFGEGAKKSPSPPSTCMEGYSSGPCTGLVSGVILGFFVGSHLHSRHVGRYTVCTELFLNSHFNGLHWSILIQSPPTAPLHVTNIAITKRYSQIFSKDVTFQHKKKTFFACSPHNTFPAAPVNVFERIWFATISHFCPFSAQYFWILMWNCHGVLIRSINLEYRRAVENC